MGLKYTAYMYYNAESCEQIQEIFVISLITQKEKRAKIKKERN